MTINEIAEAHGVSRQTVHTYRRSGVFPKPVEGEGSTRPRFRADEVAAFFVANPKRPGNRTDLPSKPYEGDTVGYDTAQLTITARVSRHNSEQDASDDSLWADLVKAVRAVVADPKYAGIEPDVDGPTL